MADLDLTRPGVYPRAPFSRLLPPTCPAPGLRQSPLLGLLEPQASKLPGNHPHSGWAGCRSKCPNRLSRSHRQSPLPPLRTGHGNARKTVSRSELTTLTPPACHRGFRGTSQAAESSRFHVAAEVCLHLLISSPLLSERHGKLGHRNQNPGFHPPLADSIPPETARSAFP
jgi:hypothetical protein